MDQHLKDAYQLGYLEAVEPGLTAEYAWRILYGRQACVRPDLKEAVLSARAKAKNFTFGFRMGRCGGMSLDFSALERRIFLQNYGGTPLPPGIPGTAELPTSVKPKPKLPKNCRLWLEREARKRTLKALCRSTIEQATGRLFRMGRCGGMLPKPNVQNMPRKPGVRECWIPAPGYVFVDADWPPVNTRKGTKDMKDLTVEQAPNSLREGDMKDMKDDSGKELGWPTLRGFPNAFRELAASRLEGLHNWEQYMYLCLCSKHEPNWPTIVRLMLGEFPDSVHGISKVATFGARKYAPDSWQTVPNAFTRYRDAFARHYLKRLGGEALDKESGHAHRAHMAWNACALGEFERGTYTEVKP